MITEKNFNSISDWIIKEEQKFANTVAHEKNKRQIWNNDKTALEILIDLKIAMNIVKNNGESEWMRKNQWL